jgi:hypothetical protein
MDVLTALVAYSSPTPHRVKQGVTHIMWITLKDWKHTTYYLVSTHVFFVLLLSDMCAKIGKYAPNGIELLLGGLYQRIYIVCSW